MVNGQLTFKLDGPIAHATQMRWEQARILLIDSVSASATAISRILRAAAAEVVWFDSVESALTQDLNYSVVMVNMDGSSPGSIFKASSELERVGLKNKVLFYSNHIRPEVFAQWLEHTSVANYMTCGDELDREELLVTLQKMIRGDLFGIDKYFVWGAHAVNRAFRSPSQIPIVLRELQSLGHRLRIPGRITSMFLGVVDELASNAIYNAPSFDKRGSVSASNTQHGARLFSAEQAVLCCFRFDGRRLGVSITDQSGTLTKDDVICSLSRCLQKHSQQNAWEGGTGFYQTYASLSHFVVNILPNERTETIGLIDVRGTFKDFASRGKSLNIFVEDSRSQSAVNA